MGNRLQDQQNQALELLNHIKDQLTFDMELEDIDALRNKVSNPEKGSASWLTFVHQAAEFTGRDKELDSLDNFYYQDAKVSWWAITGEGGLGKSRLAMESIARQDEIWEVGFLPKAKLSDANALANWSPEFPTIIVIDYAAPHSETIASWLDHLLRNQDKYSVPIRVLLLEREYKEQSWWRSLTMGDSNALARQNALFNELGSIPLELKPLEKTDQKSVLGSYLDRLRASDKVPDKDSSLWNTIHDLTKQGSPLYLGMIAVALQETAVQDVRNWDRNDLLENLYTREQTLWNEHSDLQSYSSSEREQLNNLVAFFTLVGGPISDINSPEQKSPELKNLEQKEKVLKAVISANIVSDKRNFLRLSRIANVLVGQSGAVTPDLIGEYFLLKQYAIAQDLFEEKEEHFKSAFELNPEATLETLARCATDYPEFKESYIWWEYLRNQYPESHALYEVVVDIAGTLSFNGKSQKALDTWLSLDLSAIPEKGIKAEILNMMGKTCLHLSKLDTALDYLKRSLAIREEIGDRSGEGTTLNNISQIYDTRGELDTALDYLKRSLAIREEIGDRSGEGTTLNNISQIFKARGELDTALDYLKRSLAIQEEIGDRSGEGTTLNNIASTYHARGELDTALDYLKRSLAIREEIGDLSGMCATKFNLGHISFQNGDQETAVRNWLDVYLMASQSGLHKALEALDGLAKQLGRSEGLAFWQALAEQSKKPDSER